MVCGTVVTCQRHEKFNLLWVIVLLLLLFFDWMGYSIVFYLFFYLQELVLKVKKIRLSNLDFKN